MGSRTAVVQKAAGSPAGEAVRKNVPGEEDTASARALRQELGGEDGRRDAEAGAEVHVEDEDVAGNEVLEAMGARCRATGPPEGFGPSRS